MCDLDFIVIVSIILIMFGCLVFTDICRYTYYYMKYQKLSIKEAIKQIINDYISTQY